MVMMMSFGAILTISLIVFASYGVLYWLFGGGRPASAHPVLTIVPTRRLRECQRTAAAAAISR